ncbi:sodium channel protein Nach-like [Zootermopsis nevadensis]|nr:sodium channel protein Nach-like [Zootermopsis nevadensis]
MERVFWLAVCSVSVYGCYCVCKATMEAFQQRSVSFVPETTYLGWNTGFPAVTVCEKYNRHKIWELAERTYPNADTSTLSNLAMYLGDMIYYKGKCNNCNKHCSGSTKCPGDILQLAKKVFTNCSSLLGNCYWNSVQFDCCENFYPELTPYGICYTINSLQTTKKNVAYHKTVDLISNKLTGPGRLEFNTFEDSELHVHSPEDAFHFGHQVEPDLESKDRGNSYTIYFRIMEIANDVSLAGLGVSQRGCLLPFENPLTTYKFYSSSACITECQAMAQLKLCGCVHQYTQVKGPGRTCDLEGILCIHRYSEALYEITATGLPELNVTCNCITPSCSEPEYTFITTVPVELNNNAWSHYTLQMLSLPSVRYRRNVVRSKLDLVVSIGGAVGLFLGASLISAVELIMYLCVRRTPRNA